MNVRIDDDDGIQAAFTQYYGVFLQGQTMKTTKKLEMNDRAELNYEFLDTVAWLLSPRPFHLLSARI